MGERKRRRKGEYEGVSERGEKKKGRRRDGEW